MLELRFSCCVSCWSSFICCFSESSWFWFVDEVDLEVFKPLSCSTVFLLMCYFWLSFFLSWCCFSCVLKCQSRGNSLVFPVLPIFLLSHRFNSSFQLLLQCIELFVFSYFQYLFSSCLVVLNFSLNCFKLFMVCVGFNEKSVVLTLVVVSSLVLS